METARAGIARFALIALIMLVAVVAAACGGGSDKPSGGTSAATASPAASVAATAYDRALVGIAADGTFTKETALAVFAAAIGPLPGVDTPEQLPDTSWHSGTLAIRMVQAYWPELSEAQRKAVKGYIGETAPAVFPVAYHTGLSRLDTFQQLADQAASDISSHYRPLGIPIKVVASQQEDPGGAWVWATGNWGEVPDGSPASACYLSIPPSMSGDGSRMPYLRSGTP